MEREKFDDILSIIKEIEKKNSKLEKYVSGLPVLSRNSMLEKITQDIVKNNKLFKKMGISNNAIPMGSVKKEPLIIQNIINDTISNIQANPSKKVIYLRSFLNLFEDIHENDKNVLLQSLKDENSEKLIEKMTSLSNLFKLKM
ncbi:MAG: hypothetical protein ACTSRI_02080 [Promethearchaeota archaeon]